MGTNQSPKDPSTNAGKFPRPLWQVPIFLAGVAALVGAWLLRAPADSSPRQAARQLAKARQLLSRPDGDAEAAADAAQRALELMGPDGDRLGEANFLLGTAHMRLGDRSPGDEGRSKWLTAFRFFEEAERLGVPPEDRGHLHYRLAKVCFHTGDDPRRVAERLAASAPEAEDGAEAYDLLCQAYLLQHPPDYQKALEANTKLREQSILQVDMLAKVQLRSGELKLKLGHVEEARKDLELINPAAPAAIICRARVLRARSYQEESKWGEAATLWQEALNDKREPLADRAEVLYLLGVCHQHLDQPDEAIRAWEECVRSGEAGPEAVAAAIQLVDLRLARKNYAGAIELLASVAAHIPKPGDWNNPHVTRERAIEIFENAAKTLRTAGQYELALQLTNHFERLAPTGKAVALRAELQVEWAGKQRGNAEGGKPAPEVEKTSLDLLRKAGDNYVQAAKVAVPETALEMLWQAAGSYIEGNDLTKAVATLEELLKQEKRLDRLGEGWFVLGETYRLMRNTEAAEQAYIECIKPEYPPRFAYRARYELALLFWADGRADQAEQALVDNVRFLRFDHDPEMLKKCLFALGNFAYQRHDYAEVVKRLEEALSQSPADAKGYPEQTRARYQLAESYRQLAVEAKRDELIGDSPNPEYIKHLRQKHQNFLTKAAEEYQELSLFLGKPEAAEHLTADERAEIPLIAAECRYNLGQYQDALALYKRLIAASSGHKAMLALGGAARCYSAMGQREELHQCIVEIEKALEGLDEPTKQKWQEWLRLAAKPPQ